MFTEKPISTKAMFLMIVTVTLSSFIDLFLREEIRTNKFPNTQNVRTVRVQIARLIREGREVSIWNRCVVSDNESDNSSVVFILMLPSNSSVVFVLMLPSNSSVVFVVTLPSNESAVMFSRLVSVDIVCIAKEAFKNNAYSRNRSRAKTKLTRNNTHNKN